MSEMKKWEGHTLLTARKKLNTILFPYVLCQDVITCGTNIFNLFSLSNPYKLHANPFYNEEKIVQGTL